MADDALKAVGDRLSELVEWAREQLADDLVRRAIAEDLGLQPGESIPTAELPQDKLDGVARYRASANPDREAFVTLLNDVRAIYEACRSFVGAFGLSDATVINEALYQLFDLLALSYVRVARPREYFFIQALAALARAAEELPEHDNPDVVDVSRLDTDDLTIPRIFDALFLATKFALSPLAYLFKVFDAADEAAARRTSDRIFPHLAAALALGGVTEELSYGWDSLAGSAQPRADTIAERTLSMAFPRSGPPPFEQQLEGAPTVTLALVPAGEGQASGLLIGLGGAVNMEVVLSERWRAIVALSAVPAFSLFLDTKLGTIDGQNLTNAPTRLAVVSVPDAQNVTYAIPDGEGTRLEIGRLAFAFSYDGTTGEASVRALGCALVIEAQDQDGFLAKLLPAGGLRVPFDAGLGVSSERGFFTEGDIRWPTGGPGAPAPPLGGAPAGALVLGDGPTPPLGGAPAGALVLGDAPAPQPSPLAGSRRPDLGMQLAIPIGKALLGVSLRQLLLALGPAGETGAATATAEVSLALAARIGPVTAAVERLGVAFALSFPKGGGNAGFMDLRLGLRSPEAVGIAVESAVATGAGFLAFDRERGQYAGLLQLTVHGRIVVTAIGLISTRLPGGERGYSFVALITAEGFRPIPLGLGFTLTGLGGLIALHRTVDDEFLRQSLRGRALDDILFPRDPLRNAAQLFTTLGRAFPAQEGSHLVGLVAQIRWGSPPIITVELALIAELGRRTRLVILGRLAAIMPSERNDLLRLQMNALGVIDLDQGALALDAVLYDSRLAGRFPITGSMALRLRWGTAPTFAMAIGGFHPAFAPPAGFPALERLAISFSNSESFRLRAETYLALTANTLQLGARADLYARAGGFSVEGGLGFDVLIQFDPFQFLADFYASLQLRRGSRNLFKIKLEGRLAGPRPLHFRGKASFEILWCDFSVSIDRTLVAGEPPPRPEPVLVQAQLRAALADRRSWGGQLAASHSRLVTLREPGADGRLALHPLGGLTVRQSVVPLELEIARFGSATPAGPRRFSVTGVSVNGASVAFTRTSDHFAPAQFLDLSDDEKLAAPAFELMPAGVSVGQGGARFAADDADILEEPAISYETVIAGRAGAQRAAAPFTPSADALTRQVALGAVARSALRPAEGTQAATFRTAGPAATPTRWRWAVLSAADGAPQAIPGMPGGGADSYAAALSALAELRRHSPARARGLLVARVPASRDEER